MRDSLVALLPIALALPRIINWPTALVFAVILGLVALLVGWMLTLLIFAPLFAIILIRDRERRAAAAGTASRARLDLLRRG
jgi:hypothetical protein